MLLAPTLRNDEAVIFFSHSGATRTLVSVASMAKANGVGTIAITAPQSHLAKACDITIGVQRYEHSELYTPLTARLNHFLVVNMLVAAIGLKQGRKMPDNLTALDPWLTEKFMD
jgi:RpiR family transcriptional regulator, carbohydrate utilization regulator